MMHVCRGLEARTCFGCTILARHRVSRSSCFGAMRYVLTLHHEAGLKHAGFLPAPLRRPSNLAETE